MTHTESASDDINKPKAPDRSISLVRQSESQKAYNQTIWRISMSEAWQTGHLKQMSSISRIGDFEKSPKTQILVME
jgi:hypothetical protein